MQRLGFAVVALVALIGGAAPAVASMAPSSAPVAASRSLPTLTAKVALPGGGTTSVRYALSGLSSDQFDVTKNTGATVTLTYPKRRTYRSSTGALRHVKPCAQSTFRLSATAGESDVLDRVRSIVPNANTEGSSTSVPSAGALTDAWRTRTVTPDASHFALGGANVRLVATDAGAVTRVLALDAKTMGGGGTDCAAASRYTIGPGVRELLISA